MRTWSRPVALVAAGILLRAAFWAWLPPRAYSADVTNWVVVAGELAAGRNPYESTTFLNWPPFWMPVIAGLWRLAAMTRTPFLPWLRALLCIAELAVAGLVWAGARQFLNARSAERVLVLGYVLSVPSILVVVQHGNFDVFVAVAVLAALLSLSRFQASGELRDAAVASLALGLGIFVKTVPLVLLPLFYVELARLRSKDRLLCAALALGPVAMGMLIILALAPEGVARNVLAYRSSPGWFGFSGLLDNFGWPAFGRVYAAASPIVLASLGVAMALLATRQERTSRRLFLGAFLLLFAIPVLGPGYAPQYWFWYAPLGAVVWAAWPEPSLRRALEVALAVATITYLLEYGLIDSHGKAWVWEGWVTDAVPRTFAERGPQTLLRLPLFVADLWVLVSGTFSLARSGRRTSRALATA